MFVYVYSMYSTYRRLFINHTICARRFYRTQLKSITLFISLFSCCFITFVVYKTYIPTVNYVFGIYYITIYYRAAYFKVYIYLRVYTNVELAESEKKILYLLLSVATALIQNVYIITAILLL